MAFEVQATSAESQPPNLIIVGVASNVDSWDNQTLVIPNSGEKGFTRRALQLMVLRATNGAATAQLSSDANVATHAVLSRGGKSVSIHIPSRLYISGIVQQGDTEGSPLCWWNNPFVDAVRGGDSITIFVPGDADATPIQDWELELQFGRELRKGQRR